MDNVSLIKQTLSDLNTVRGLIPRKETPPKPIKKTSACKILSTMEPNSSPETDEMYTHKISVWEKRLSEGNLDDYFTARQILIKNNSFNGVLQFGELED